VELCSHWASIKHNAVAERPVSLKKLSSGREASNVSHDLGRYSFPGSLPGDYELSVPLAGFERVRRRIRL